MQPDDRATRERLLHRAVLAGDQQAWQALYEESFDALQAYVRWRCGGHSDHLEETVQETWLTAVRRIRRFDPQRGSFLAWLRGIAANTLRNRFRRDRWRRKHIGPLNGQPVDRGTTRGLLEIQARAEQVAASLAGLPDHYEQILRAKYLDRQTVAQIAAARRETEKTVESLLSRARQAFRKAYRLRE